MITMLGKKVSSIGVLGIGKSNIALVRHINQRYPTLHVILRHDGSAPDNMRLSSLKFHELILGDSARENIKEDILFLSPTTRRSEIISSARLSSDVELFFSEKSGNTFTVTGSDGKSTTTLLSSQILCASGIPSEPLGNYGTPLAAAIDKEITPVVELSSFQLMDYSPPATRCAITNISENHLDWHRDFSEYIWAKSHIMDNSSGVVLDYDSLPLRELAHGRSIYAAASYSMDCAALSNAVHAKHYISCDSSYILVDGRKYVSLSQALRRESYNIRNMMLAIGLTLEFSQKDKVQSVINGFTGLPHRCEVVAEADKIQYINSSIDTSPKRTLETLRHMAGPGIIILAGRSKGGDITELCHMIKAKSIGAILLGEAIPRYKNELSPNTARCANSMKSAILAAKELLPDGGYILLSPSGTSFDSYQSYEERGLDFKKSVYDILS